MPNRFNGCGRPVEDWSRKVKKPSLSPQYPSLPDQGDSLTGRGPIKDRLRGCVRAHWSGNPSVRRLEAWLKLQVSGTLTRLNHLRGNGYFRQAHPKLKMFQNIELHSLWDPTIPIWKTRMTWFTDIVNGLEALGKTYKESEKVMKILRSLPSKWHTKLTTKEEEDVEEEKSSDEDDDLALIIRKLNKYMRCERFRGRKFTSRRDPSKKESSSHGDKEK
ncbi:hypothetical protein CK203_062262 [Vitis vinifera]|uniref:Uncharacterized protein n=1 Tax=Vitis vinifera TaxID=29760 RepID=A0A438FRE7_VITVI|nr:hypothetical protein CK203_062262 [Vitis vinifera]